MAKKRPKALSLLLPRAGERLAGGWPAGDESLEAVSTQPRGSCKCLPQGLERWPSPVHAWMGARPRVGRSSSGALSLHPPPPLNNTILPSKIKLYLYLYNTPSSPALPSRSSRGLCYRQGIAGARWVPGEHPMGRGCTPAPSCSPGTRGGGGGKWGGGLEQTNTQPHALKRLGSSEMGVQGTLGTRQAPGPVQHSRTHTDTGKGAPGASHADSPRQGRSRVTAAGPKGRRQAVRWGPWGARVSPSSGSRWGGRGSGPRWGAAPAGGDRQGGGGPHSTLQQLMQPFWEP